MASQVFVISPNARQVTVKTKPETCLADVLMEACNRFRLDPSKYGLKNNNRDLDLSNAMRHSGLSPGARLQLTLFSKSPSVISVALQLPASEAKGPSGIRLTDKFPSDTTLWLVLRKFEAGTAGDPDASRNFTGRGITIQGAGGGHSGRLYYETPVLEALGRSWDSFSNLQKTLAQIGFTKGSVLFRLAFRPTETPLEEAMQQMNLYFKSPDVSASTEPESSSGAILNKATGVELNQGQATGRSGERIQEIGSGLMYPSVMPVKEESTTSESSHALAITSQSGSRLATVFAPPSSNTPQAARLAHNPQDFVPTVEHAKAHQALLGRSIVNKRLLSDAEIAAQEATQVQKLVATEHVDIKLRFPDQSSVVAAFSQTDTVNDLYDYVQSLLARENEPFGLQYADKKGNRPLVRGSQRLIANVGMSSKVLITVTWEDGASGDARTEKSLKKEIAAQGREISIQAPLPVEEDSPSNIVGRSDTEHSDEKSKGKKGVPKWLKLPGRK